MAFALQQFQNASPEFHPFDSKYDRFLAGTSALDTAELRGLALFNNPAKGNCAACHASAKGADGAAPLFTDFSFDNLGVPRNAAIPATADAGYFDLGICGPDRTDLSDRAELCGAFKVPTLRNVATRKVFFHNGRFNNLRDVLRFYVRRDTNPEEWYPLAADGTIQKFNDVPAAYRRNVNTTEAPYNRQPGMAPALSDEEIDDVIKFLGTLIDGYQVTQ
jgi:cytochrome c peroxidase